MQVIVAIASRVARGHVGNSVVAFALQRLGFEVWDVPTVLLPFHPGHGPGRRIDIPAETLAGLLSDLAEKSDLTRITGIVSGYLGAPGQAAAVARFVDAVKAAQPTVVYCCDPVMGDNGAFYVPDAVASGIKTDLVPLADMVTPNRFELATLSGRRTETLEACLDAALSLGPVEVHVTSAPALMRRHAAILSVSPDNAMMAEAPAIDMPPHGVGDLLAALLLAHRLRGLNLEDRVRKAMASVHDLARQTERKGLFEMPLAEEQHRLLQSATAVRTRRLSLP